MSLNMTENAVEEVKKVIQEQGVTDLILTLAVVGGGCSGFSYSMKFKPLSELGDKYVIYNFHGLDVAVDKRSEMYLEETTIDFYTGIEKRGFLFNNGLIKHTCGCGKSFAM